MAGLCRAARTLIDTAEVLIGGERHLAMIPSNGPAAPTLAHRRWPRWPIARVRPRTPRRRPRDRRPAAVRDRRDPVPHGSGGGDHVFPPSPPSHAAARLAWPLEGVAAIMLQGRPVEQLAPHLPRCRLLLLPPTQRSPPAVAAWLAAQGFGESRMIALAHMGGAEGGSVRGHGAFLGGEVPDFQPSPWNALRVRMRAGCRARRGCRTTPSSMTAS